MLRIRLQRTGRVHEPTFRIVLTDRRNSTKSGRFLEVLGNYDPRRKGSFAVKEERVRALLSTGAKLSDTLHNLFITKKIIDGKKINLAKSKKTETAATATKSPEEVKSVSAETKIETAEPKAEAVESPAPAA